MAFPDISGTHSSPLYQVFDYLTMGLPTLVNDTIQGINQRNYQNSVQQGSSQYASYMQGLDAWLQSAMKSFDTNALAEANRAADRTNAFNANQAEINRRFQQQSAQTAMNFESAQAQLDRDFQRSMVSAQQTFNAAEAQKNRDFQQASAREAMSFEAAQAQAAMDYSERMRNTQYQAAVNDMRAAGLNPMLAYMNMNTGAPQGVAGSGSAASGSTASSSAASGRSASGRSASGSQASGVKSDTNSALSADRQALSNLLGLISLNVNSALETSNQSLKLLDITFPNFSKVMK